VYRVRPGVVAKAYLRRKDSVRRATMEAEALLTVMKVCDTYITPLRGGMCRDDGALVMEFDEYCQYHEKLHDIRDLLHLGEDVANVHCYCVTCVTVNMCRHCGQCTKLVWFTVT